MAGVARPRSRCSRRRPRAGRRLRLRIRCRPARPAWGEAGLPVSACRLSSRRGAGANVNRKLVVFVPAEALDAVRDAVFAAGAGRIGDYERCSWYTEGTGTFYGAESTDPSVGKKGREERVPELRLETGFPEAR